MIDWAVFRMMTATRIEQQAWSAVASHGPNWWLAHDYQRTMALSPSDKPIKNGATFEKHNFETRREADDYVTYRIHRAALLAVLCFWRKL